MKGLTDYLTEQSWKDTIIASFVFVDDYLREAQRRLGFRRRRGPAPKHDDSVIIGIALVAEYWFGGDEDKALAFLRQYHADPWSSGIPDAGRLNGPRRALTLVMEDIRRQLPDRSRAERPAADHAESEGSDLKARTHPVDSAVVILATRPRGQAKGNRYAPRKPSLPVSVPLLDSRRWNRYPRKRFQADQADNPWRG
ncbi:MAG: hypothetical protein ONB30_00180 [candidate division KSB1 bacterium]|nr:hypothetical protein [candidate division KSB1 bacterium]